MEPATGPAPTVNEVIRITSLAGPVIRNLEITHCYFRLSVAFAAHTGPCANWCTFATWASRQAGRTIRGEDLLEDLERKLKLGPEILHPVQSLWRALLRRGLFNPDTRLGRIVREIHSPFDAFESASDAVARGNLKVFEEIAAEFARYLETCPPDAALDSPQFQAFLSRLRSGDPPDGQNFLRRAFSRYQQQSLEPDPRVRAQLVFLANLEIGLHEQTRLQPEIREALDVAPATAHDLGNRIRAVLFPRSGFWRAAARPAAPLLDRLARSLQRFSVAVSRRVITDRLMVLALPGGNVLALGRHLNAAFPESLRELDNPDLVRLLERFEPASPAPDDCGAEDWSELSQRMHFIVHLFRAFHERSDLFQSPFTPVQIRAFQSGAVPDGEL